MSSESGSDEPNFHACDLCNLGFYDHDSLHDHLRDEHASLFANSNDDFVEQVLGRRPAQTNLQTPPAGEIYSIGPNLARFRDFILALPRAAATDQLTSSTIVSYLDSPQQRELAVTVSEIFSEGDSEEQEDGEAEKWISVRSVAQLQEGTDDSEVDRYDLVFSITSLDLNDDQQALLCSCLKELLERVPKNYPTATSQHSELALDCGSDTCTNPRFQHPTSLESHRSSRQATNQQYEISSIGIRYH